MNITLLVIVLVAYFVGMLAVGFAGRKYASSFSSLVSAGKNAGVVMIAASCIGGQIGNGFVIGGAAGAAISGLSGSWYGIGCGLSWICVAFILNKTVFAKGFYSLPDLLEERYGDKLTSIIFSTGTAVSYIGNIAAQIMAGSALFKALGLDGTLGAVVITVVVLLYSLFAGLWGAYATSVVQTAIIIIGMVIISIIVLVNGGIDTINGAIAQGQVPSSYWNIGACGLAAILMTAVPVCTSTLCDQQVVQRINAAKSERSSFIGHIIAGVVCMAAALMPAVIGMYGAAAYGVSDSSVFFVVAMNALPDLVCALAIAAVIAAIMSTISSMLVGFSTIMMKNVYKGLLKPSATDKELSRGNSVVTVVVGLLSLFVSLQFTSIIDALCNAYLILSACCMVPFLGALFWKKGTAKGAVWSSVVGMLVMLLYYTKIFVLPTISLSSIAVTAIVYVAVSLLDKKVAEE